MKISNPEAVLSGPEGISSHLAALRTGLATQAFANYPPFTSRLFMTEEGLAHTPTGQLILPSGPWTVDSHPNQTDSEVRPSEATKATLDNQGLELDSLGRPLHPWTNQMLTDPTIGILCGKGFYRQWGPNKTVDPIIIKNNHVLLIRRKDTGAPALPGGFIDKGELAADAGRREVEEETGFILPPIVPTLVYDGPVADIRMTANAWPETTGLLFNLSNDGTGLAELVAGDDADRAAWVALDSALQLDNLFGSSRYLIERAVETLSRKN